MKFVSINEKNIITSVSKKNIGLGDCKIMKIDTNYKDEELLGKQIVFEKQNLKIAIICNWHDNCGISTYTEYLVNSLSKISQIKIFSEINKSSSEEVVYCWKRGESMAMTIQKIKEWSPDFIIIQHEYGLFPKATHFLKMLQDIDNIPYMVVLHSVYEHLDKTICTSAIKNIVVHSSPAKDMLKKLGNNGEIFVISHGCVKFDNVQELWNIFQTPYCIVQFGFGFFYKGVDRAIQAVAHLKKTSEKYKDIFYCYLCSNNDKCNNIHNDYYEYLQKIKIELDVEDNVVIIQQYNTEEIINNYLRTAKIAIFPYLTDSNNTVYGASGAIRIAMANKIPVIASESHLFDDLDGIVPRPKTHLELAKEMSKIFSNGSYKEELLNKADAYLNNNTWDIIARKYLDVAMDIIKKDKIVIPNCKVS